MIRGDQSHSCGGYSIIAAWTGPVRPYTEKIASATEQEMIRGDQSHSCGGYSIIAAWTGPVRPYTEKAASATEHVQVNPRRMVSRSTFLEIKWA